MNSNLPKEAREKVPDWKCTHGRIYATRIDGVWYVFRRLTYREYMVVLPNLADGGLKVLHPLSVELVDYITNRTLLYPNEIDYSNQLAGLQHKLAVSIVHKSSYNASEFERVFTQFKDLCIKDADYKSILVICRVFPSLTPDTIRSWSLEKIVEHLAMAQTILEEANARDGNKVGNVNNNKTKQTRRFGDKSTTTKPLVDGKIDFATENMEFRRI